MDKKITWVTVRINVDDAALVNVRIPFLDLQVYLDSWDGITSFNENFNRLITTTQEVLQEQMDVRKSS